MRRIITPLFILSMISAPAIFAQDTNVSDNQQPGSAVQDEVVINEEDVTINDYSKTDHAGQPGTADAVTTAQAEEVASASLGGQAFGLVPQIGAINYHDTQQGVNTRNLIGLMMDFNATQYFRDITGMGETFPLYIGPSIGFFYSHIGGNGGDFWGNGSSAETGGDGVNMMLLPINMKFGWNVTDSFRLALHGGANAFYRSNASAMALGLTPTAGSSNEWTVLPNLGADIEFGIANKYAIVFRPDYSPSGSNPVYTATLGAAFFLG